MKEGWICLRGDKAGPGLVEVTLRSYGGGGCVSSRSSWPSPFRGHRIDRCCNEVREREGQTEPRSAFPVFSCTHEQRTVLRFDRIDWIIVKSRFKKDVNILEVRKIFRTVQIFRIREIQNFYFILCMRLSTLERCRIEYIGNSEVSNAWGQQIN